MKRFFKPTKGGGQPSPQPASQPTSLPSSAKGKTGRRDFLRPYFGNPSSPESWFTYAQRQEVWNRQKAQEKGKKIRLTQPPKF